MPTVKACVKDGTARVRLDDLQLDDPGPGQALIRTELTTICGSDLHLVDEMPMPEGMPQGHEAVGVVEAIGQGVERIAVGDRVVVGCAQGCGHCHVCQAGDSSVCVTLKAPFNVLFGCQAEAFLVNYADLNTAIIPASMDSRQVLFAGDIMSTGFAAIERGELKPGQSVVVFAQGPVGLCATAGARHYGAGRIIAVESVPERIEMARRLGADEVVPPEGAVERIMELTDGKGVDLAVEALGRAVTFEGCLAVTRPGGTVSSVGVYADVETLPLPSSIAYRHKRIVFSMCPSGTERLEYLMTLVESGAVDLTPLWTHDMELAQIVEGYDQFRSRRDGTIKIAISA